MQAVSLFPAENQYSRELDFGKALRNGGIIPKQFFFTFKPNIPNIELPICQLKVKFT